MFDSLCGWLQHALSRVAGSLGRSRVHWFKNFLIRHYIRIYSIDLSSALESHPDHYACFNDFFTHRLKPEARVIDPDPQGIISPVDGRVSQWGSMENETLLQAKGLNYTLNALLAHRHIDSFLGGKFITLYLSPRDYHHVHMPFPGTLKETVIVPGRLFSVKESSVNKIPDLFTRNERVIGFFHTEMGSMAVIFVGALIVGSIHTEWAGKVTPCAPRTLQVTSYPKDQFYFARGDHLGYFELGSTVILLFQNPELQWDSELNAQSSVKFGEKIGVASTDSRQNKKEVWELLEWK